MRVARVHALRPTSGRAGCCGCRHLLASRSHCPRFISCAPSHTHSPILHLSSTPTLPPSTLPLPKLTHSHPHLPPLAHPSPNSVQAVWASKYNERAYISTRKVGLNFDDVRMAVLSQVGARSFGGAVVCVWW